VWIVPTTRSFTGWLNGSMAASDGVQAFVGIVCAVLWGDYRAILIDEPEAFLHPPLARKLGRQLTTNLAAFA
jgi:predicted ATPase